jgi:hypothetical protein
VLERSLLFTFVMHGAGMIAMALWLLPGMPGGGADDAARVAYVASHPWLWRLGWLPWQLTAVSDLYLSLALVRTKWVPRVPAVFALLLTVAAVIPDQLGQLRWITTGIELARTDAAQYLAFESRTFQMTAVWGGVLYTLGALGWTWCFAAAGVWSRTLTVLSAILWPVFFAGTLGPIIGIAPPLVALANAMGFVLLEAWFVLVAAAIDRRAWAAGPPVANSYRELLADCWDELPRGMQAVHAAGRLRGAFSIAWGTNAAARLLAWACRLPRAGENVPVELAIVANARGLSWARRMGNETVATEQRAHRGLLVESFGPMEFRFRIRRDGETLVYEQVGAGVRFVGYSWPLPRALSLRISARSRAEGDGARTEVEIAAPWIGRVLRYEGFVSGALT